MINGSLAKKRASILMFSGLRSKPSDSNALASEAGFGQFQDHHLVSSMRKLESVNAEEHLDGINVIRTNLREEALGAREVVGACKSPAPSLASPSAAGAPPAAAHAQSHTAGRESAGFGREPAESLRVAV